MKKYEFTGETKNVTKANGQIATLHRIRALKNFSNVKAGELGGWIEHDENLSQSCNAWVYNNARVYGNAIIFDDAKVYGDAQVYDDATVCGDAWVSGDARVSDNAKISGNAKIYHNAWVYNNARVYGNAIIFDDAKVYGDAQVYGNATVYGDAWVFDNAKVYGDAKVYGNAAVCSEAVICLSSHILVIGPIGSRGGFTTFYHNRNDWISVRCGCFNGDIEDFLAEVTKTHGDNKHARMYRDAARLATVQISGSDMKDEAKE